MRKRTSSPPRVFFYRFFDAVFFFFFTLFLLKTIIISARTTTTTTRRECVNYNTLSSVYLLVITHIILICGRHFRRRRDPTISGYCLIIARGSTIQFSRVTAGSIACTPHTRERTSSPRGSSGFCCSRVVLGRSSHLRLLLLLLLLFVLRSSRHTHTRFSTCSCFFIRTYTRIRIL